jgi:hypothetical protein
LKKNGKRPAVKKIIAKAKIHLYAINGSTLGVTTFTQIEDGLKIMLLLVTIGYTIAKWKGIKKDEDNK